MPAHIHAALMMEYAKDAAESETPWRDWEYLVGGDVKWATCFNHPSWNADDVYRRKPKTIRIGDMEVPDPMKTKPERGSRYYCPNVISTDLNDIHIWCDDFYDNEILNKGFCHATQEAATAHAKAFIKISGGKVD